MRKPYIQPIIEISEIEEDRMICTSVGGSDGGMGGDPDDPNKPTVVDPDDPGEFPFPFGAKAFVFDDEFLDYTY